MSNPLKNILFALASVFVAGGFVFIVYQAAFAAWTPPNCQPPDCQPEGGGGGGGASTLLDVLDKGLKGGNPIADSFGELTDNIFKGVISIGGKLKTDGSSESGRVKFGLGTSTPGFSLDIVSQKRETGQTDSDKDTAVARLGYSSDDKVWTGLRLDRNANKDQEKWFIGMDNASDRLIVKSKDGSNSTTILDVDPQTGVVQSACAGSFLVGVTAAHDGNAGGYVSANALCSQSFAGSHVCTTAEILKSAQCKVSMFSQNGIVDKAAWISNGPPGYTANSNDCGGWSSNASDYLGAYWVFNAQGGEGGIYGCDESAIFGFACCK